ncbi:MAG: hypothetical protein JXR91_04655, partial [Deltaproteobacteria bacterium]|nr:hypothetical protein [Deltaproteobacteria bacterium]
MFASDKTLGDLEWKLLLEHIAKRASSPESEQQCLNLPFLNDKDARFHMRLVDEFVTCINNDDTPPLLDIIFQNHDLVRLESGGDVDREFFLAVSNNIRVFLDLARYVENRRDILPLNSKLVIPDKDHFSMIALSRLAAQIDSTFAPDGTISDSASSKLAALRKRARALRANLLDEIDKISKKNSDILGETTVTLRNDRYVLPVRTDKHRTLKGIVHGSSATGGTFFVEPEELV